jgi:hypothetical protein
MVLRSIGILPHHYALKIDSSTSKGKAIFDYSILGLLIALRNSQTSRTVYEIILICLMCGSLRLNHNNCN